MALILLVEGTFVLLLLTFAATQVALPLWRGTVLFPLLRRRQLRDLELELARVRQEREEERLRREIEAERAGLREAADERETVDRVRGIRLADDPPARAKEGKR